MSNCNDPTTSQHHFNCQSFIKLQFLYVHLFTVRPCFLQFSTNQPTGHKAEEKKVQCVYWSVQ